MPLEDFAIDAVKISSPVKIDGILDEDCWQQTSVITDFTQWVPDQEEHATERTVCHLAYDEHHLYFTAKCYESDPDLVTANIDNRDAIFGDDWIMLMLDSYSDMRSAYEFVVNPFGIQADLIQLGDHDDMSWDAVWYSKGKKTDFGWQIEMAIPFECIRFSSDQEQVWRFQVMRRIAHKGEMNCYVPFRKIDNNPLSRTAEFVGLVGISQSQHVDLLPYLTARHKKGEKPPNQAELGGDLKYTVSSNLVLDLTVNPDFGQVEADIDQINLSPYELYLQEKRPFSLEKMDVFDTPYSMFYSRRLSNPVAGARLTGKIGKYGLGMLYARNENENISTDEDFGVVRIQRDILSESKIGIIVTDKEKQDGYNRVVAGDMRIVQGSFILNSQFARSFSDGSSQLAWIGYNNLYFSRNNVNIAHTYSFAENDFEAEAGFVTPLYTGLNFQPVSYRKNRLSASYKLLVNNGWLRHVSPLARFSMTSSYEGTTLDKSAYARVSAEFDRNVTTSIGFTRKRQFWQGDDHDTYDYYLFVSANPSKYFTVESYVGEGNTLDYWNARTVWQRDFSLSVDLRPTSRVEISPLLNHASQYERRGGDKTFTQWIGLLRVAYNHSSNVFVKVFLQGNSFSDSYTANFLFAYTFLPGSTFYLAYNSGYDDSTGAFHKDSEIVFAKISYLMGL